jgi:hypothetical protein
MANNFCVSLTHAKDNADKATVAFVVANAAVGSCKQTLVFLSVEGVLHEGDRRHGATASSTLRVHSCVCSTSPRRRTTALASAVPAPSWKPARPCACTRTS